MSEIIVTMGTSCVIDEFSNTLYIPLTPRCLRSAYNDLCRVRFTYYDQIYILVKIGNDPLLEAKPRIIQYHIDEATFNEYTLCDQITQDIRDQSC